MGSKFIDEATITVRSGSGGAGCVSFRREKFVPFGGPDGGDGGRGGDVVIQTDPNLSTLLDYRYKKKHIAQNGRPGEGNQRTGADGEPAILHVPAGTVIYDAASGEVLLDATETNATHVLLRGGRGGKGNQFFKTSVRQAPRVAQPGESGEELSIRLELKLLADVGLVGFPNVGKSSLIAHMSAARPKVASYPFTTLVPNLGVVQFGDLQSYVAADVPGLVVGAHEGVGLGTQFLRHVERVRVICHLVTAVEGIEERSPIQDFEAIEGEIRTHNPDLATVPRVLVLNQVDLPFVREHSDSVHAYAQEHELPFFAVSAATGEGVKELTNYLGEVVSRGKAKVSGEPTVIDAT